MARDWSKEPRPASVDGISAEDLADLEAYIDTQSDADLKARSQKKRRILELRAAADKMEAELSAEERR